MIQARKALAKWSLAFSARVRETRPRASNLKRNEGIILKERNSSRSRQFSWRFFFKKSNIAIQNPSDVLKYLHHTGVAKHFGVGILCGLDPRLQLWHDLFPPPPPVRKFPSKFLLLLFMVEFPCSYPSSSSDGTVTTRLVTLKKYDTRVGDVHSLAKNPIQSLIILWKMAKIGMKSLPSSSSNLLLSRHEHYEQNGKTKSPDKSYAHIPDQSRVQVRERRVEVLPLQFGHLAQATGDFLHTIPIDLLIQLLLNPVEFHRIHHHSARRQVHFLLHVAFAQSPHAFPLNPSTSPQYFPSNLHFSKPINQSIKQSYRKSSPFNSNFELFSDPFQVIFTKTSRSGSVMPARNGPAKNSLNERVCVQGVISMNWNSGWRSEMFRSIGVPVTAQ